MLFLYREVLQQYLDLPIRAVRAKRPKRLPTVLTREEVHQALTQLSGIHRLMTQLLYRSGLRLMECVRLHIKDLDFTQHQIIIRDGKGMQDRVTIVNAGSPLANARSVSIAAQERGQVQRLVRLSS